MIESAYDRVTLKDFFKKVPDLSLHFDELAEHFRSEYQQNQDNMKLIEMHKDFETKMEKGGIQPKKGFLKVRKLIDKKFVEDQFLDWVKDGSEDRH